MSCLSLPSHCLLPAVMTQSMSFSPYKKPFEERLNKWNAQLTLVSEVVDAWLALQRGWMWVPCHQHCCQPVGMSAVQHCLCTA